MARPTNLSSTATMTGQEPLSPFGFAVNSALPTNEVFSPLSLFRLLRLGRTRQVPSLMPASRMGESSEIFEPLSLAINDTANHVINATEATSVGSTVAGTTRLKRNRHGRHYFADADNHQVTMNIIAGWELLGEPPRSR